MITGMMDLNEMDIDWDKRPSSAKNLSLTKEVESVIAINNIAILEEDFPFSITEKSEKHYFVYSDEPVPDIEDRGFRTVYCPKGIVDMYFTTLEVWQIQKLVAKNLWGDYREVHREDIKDTLIFLMENNISATITHYKSIHKGIRGNILIRVHGAGRGEYFYNKYEDKKGKFGKIEKTNKIESWEVR